MHDTQGWGDVILQDRLHSLHGVLNETAWHVIWRWQPDIYLFYHYYYFWRLWTGTLQVVCRPLLCRADWYAWWGSGGFVGPGEQWWLLSWPHLVLMQNWASLYLYLLTLHLLGCKYVPLTWISPNAALVQSWTFCTILMRKHPLIIWIQPTLGTLQENTSTLLYKLKQLTVNSTATVLFCQLNAQRPWWWHCEHVNQVEILLIYKQTCSQSSGSFLFSKGAACICKMTDAMLKWGHYLRQVLIMKLRHLAGSCEWGAKQKRESRWRQIMVSTQMSHRCSIQTVGRRGKNGRQMAL